MSAASDTLKTDIARLMAENARLRADLVDAAALHLADEQSVRNMERVIAGLRADLAEQTSECRSLRERLKDATTDLARVTGELDKLMASARAVTDLPLAWRCEGDGTFVKTYPWQQLLRVIDALRAAVEACK